MDDADVRVLRHSQLSAKFFEDISSVEILCPSSGARLLARVRERATGHGHSLPDVATLRQAQDGEGFTLSLNPSPIKGEGVLCGTSDIQQFAVGDLSRNGLSLLMV